ncbi:DNA-processing protein DprA [Corynebacterium aquilae]|uniref:DNA-processing protein DprA n=1 Tax=Corynebacterium aquilae TaxID=203263 RepID=UPI000ABBF687|nr:DNA-processing protein DprA [Corynebacterium aquilae]
MSPTLSGHPGSRAVAPSAERHRHAVAFVQSLLPDYHPELTALMHQGHSVVEIATAIAQGDRWVGQVLLHRAQTRMKHPDAAQVLQGAREDNIELLVPTDPAWPHHLDRAIATGTGPHQTHHPLGLWISPSRSHLLAQPAIAIVGTRTMSPYGKKMTEKIVADIADAGYVIISGGAVGIDTVAHRTALERGAPTIAVAASGLSTHTTRTVHELRHAIEKGGGMMLSEYAPQVRPARHRFLTRNRLIAALASAVIVVEASWRSGSLNTASWARAFNVPLFAVPGPADSSTSAGCHHLIARRRARLVSSGAEVIKALTQHAASQAKQLPLWQHR